MLARPSARGRALWLIQMQKHSVRQGPLRLSIRPDTRLGRVFHPPDIRHLIPKTLLTHKAVNKDSQALWCKSNYLWANGGTSLQPNLLSALTGSSFFPPLQNHNLECCMHDMEQFNFKYLLNMKGWIKHASVLRLNTAVRKLHVEM